MRRIYDGALASMDFTLAWTRGGIVHTDTVHAERVNFWRDILPPGLYERLADAPGEGEVAIDYPCGEALPERSPARVFRVPRERLRTDRFPGIAIGPDYGRYYPCGILHGVPGVFAENVSPFRCTSVGPDAIEADLNHPLAGTPLQLRVAMRALRPKFEEHGGTSTDWLEVAADGPGMKARANGRPTDFFSRTPFARADERDDTDFYARPRFVQHLDAAARRVVTGLYGRLVRPGASVLDLMGSWTSHLPDDLPFGGLAVLGLNRAELERNARADERVVHDLNRDPQLPFASGRFDAVVCTVSVEYLTRPFEVFAEIARVLAPGGVLVHTFSNRWFPPKAVRIWTELHEFERPGLVLEYFLNSGQYTAIETYSQRGLPRPADDPYIERFATADPVYAVWGRKEG